MSTKQNGFGAFFYPGPLTVNSTYDKLGKPPGYLRRIVAGTFEYEDQENLKITDDGFICIFTEREDFALKRLNTVFATASLAFGISTDTAEKDDLCRFTFVADQNLIMINDYALQKGRNCFSFQRDSTDEKVFVDWRSVQRRVVKQEEFRTIVETAREVTSLPDLYEDLILLFNGYTLFYRGAFAAAFLYGWMIIEAFLGEMWEGHVDSLQRSARDKDILKDHNRWTTYHHIEMLSAITKMDPGTRDLFHRFRKKRNDIIHNKEEVTEEEAFKCLHAGWKILRNRSKNPSDRFVDVSINP